LQEELQGTWEISSSVQEESQASRIHLTIKNKIITPQNSMSATKENFNSL